MYSLIKEKIDGSALSYFRKVGEWSILLLVMLLQVRPFENKFFYLILFARRCPGRLLIDTPLTRAWSQIIILSKVPSVASGIL